MLSNPIRPARSADWYEAWWIAELANPGSEYRRPLADSRYVPIWDAILDRIDREEAICEFGCGNGRFAEYAILRFRPYQMGFDLSPAAVVDAEERLGHDGMFLCGDILEPEIYHLCDYDVAVFNDSLDHVDDALLALRNVPEGMHVILSVPDYDWEGHTRHLSLGEWKTYLSDALDIQTALTVPMPPHGNVFVIEGFRW